MSVRFFVGLSRPADARHFPRACISVNRLAHRRLVIDCPEILVDSGAFSEILLHGGFRASVATYAAELLRLHSAGVAKIAAAVAQDFMCEPFMLKRTGLSLADHQRLTIERYDELAAQKLHAGVRHMLATADSMAWSFAARKQGRDRNSWREAKAFADRIEGTASRGAMPWQMPLPLWREAA